MSILKKKAWLNEDCYVPRSDLFTFLSDEKLSFEQLMAEQDLRERARQAINQEERKELARLYRWQRTAEAFQSHLDRSYTLLTGDL